MIRERIETVIDAVEDATGHVGVTVIEAVGHGRQRGITHEYRGRIFESRFLPKALLIFVVEDDLVDARRRGDHGRRAQRQRVGRRARAGRRRSATSCTTARACRWRRWRSDDRSASNKPCDRGQHDLGRHRSRARHVHAGRLRVPRGGAHAHEERRPRRGEERPDLRARVDRLLPRRLRHRVRRRRQRPRRRLGLRPVGRPAARGRQAPFSWFSEIPGAAGYLFEVVFCAVSLAIVWGAMAERTKLWVYFAFGDRLHADLLARLALGLEP